MQKKDIIQIITNPEEIIEKARKFCNERKLCTIWQYQQELQDFEILNFEENYKIAELQRRKEIYERSHIIKYYKPSFAEISKTLSWLFELNFHKYEKDEKKFYIIDDFTYDKKYVRIRLYSTKEDVPLYFKGSRCMCTNYFSFHKQSIYLYYGGWIDRDTLEHFSFGHIKSRTVNSFTAFDVNIGGNMTNSIKKIFDSDHIFSTKRIVTDESTIRELISFYQGEVLHFQMKLQSPLSMFLNLDLYYKSSLLGNYSMTKDFFINFLSILPNIKNKDEGKIFTKKFPVNKL